MGARGTQTDPAVCLGARLLLLCEPLGQPRFGVGGLEEKRARAAEERRAAEKVFEAWKVASEEFAMEHEQRHRRRTGKLLGDLKSQRAQAKHRSELAQLKRQARQRATLAAAALAWLAAACVTTSEPAESAGGVEALPFAARAPRSSS